ncbi:hypothetical protein X777_00526 [Ooceraea biroi]|uniref:Uncharacterized protein n=1 Tax=Ooceraea biroi TaxID=2015173 RepID=A0A026WR08_OOCBI|nr:hypothetical protein X777_00526 [Ooceraea biroi]
MLAEKGKPRVSLRISMLVEKRKKNTCASARHADTRHVTLDKSTASDVIGNPDSFQLNDSSH